MKRKIYALFILVALCRSAVFAEERITNRDRIIWLATEISGHFDSSPDPKCWEELHKFGGQAIPIVAELIHTEENRSNPRMILVLSQLKGNDRLIASELRRYIGNTHTNVGLRSENAFKMALRCLSRVGERKDIEELQRFECHSNIYISATAKRARHELVQRLDSRVDRVVVQPVHVQAVDTNGVVDTPLEKVVNKKHPAEEKTDGPSEDFKWARILTFVVVAVSGFLFVFFRRWGKH